MENIYKLDVFILFLLILEINTQVPSFNSYDPCMYVGTSNNNALNATCLNAGDNCCTFYWSYNVYESLEFYACINKTSVVKYGKDLIKAFTSGLEDLDVAGNISQTMKFWCKDGNSSNSKFLNPISILILSISILFIL